MTTNKLATALGAAVLLLGVSATYAAAAERDRDPGKPENPGGVHQCEDGVDNDPENADGIDFAGGDPDCGSPRDNSESPEQETQPEPPGGGSPALPPELQAVVDQVLAALEPEQCQENCPPAEPGPQEQLQALIDEVVGQLPTGELPPAPTPEELQAAVEDVIGQLPLPPTP